MALKVSLQIAECLDLPQEWDHARDLIGVDQMILEDGELAGVLDRVVAAVLLSEEVVDLRRRELVCVTAVDTDDERIAWFDENFGRPRSTDDMPGQDLLP